MNRNLMRKAIQLGALIVLVGWASWAPAAPKPVNVAHACDVTVADRAGDSILSDGEGVYTEGVEGVAARLWDMTNVADHLTFWTNVGGDGTGRFLVLRLSLPNDNPELPDVVITQTCASGKLMPNRNANNYQFYNNLPIGSSTADVGENFGGSFECYFGPGNRDSYGLTYQSQCIVITHTADKVWTITANAGCTAQVNKVDNRKLKGTWYVDVPFEVTATERP